MAKKNLKHTQSQSINDVDPVVEFKYKQGVSRPFLISTPSENLSIKRKLSTRENLYLFILIVFALYIRLTRISKPDSVVFDEVHFGGFSKKYILGQFFMDVHPPLAKMLFAGVASIGRFRGNFDFSKIGEQYPEDVPYVLMRALPAFLGVGTVVLCYLTLKASGCRPFVALLTSAALVIENANVTISRFILLDSPLLFFIAASVYSFKKFEIEVPFTKNWYKSLLTTGIALGLAVSSKWVGLFTIAWVGILCVYQLWFIIGDLTVPTKKVFGHAVTRAVLLLGVPIALYVSFFAIHFSILSNEGDGSPFMSSAFRSTLNGNRIPTNILADVGVHSEISIRHIDTQGGYLHSHDHLYETGSKQQQITLYPHLDLNNNWIIELYNVSDPPTDFEPITDGTKIRLLHKNTFRRLHSHDEKPPVSEQDWQKEVSAYGYQGFGGDANDDFIVEIVKKKSKKGVAQEKVRALETVFRLRHAMTGCYLFSSNTKLPKWAFEQQEVTCASQGLREKSYWYIETNENQYLPPNSERINYKKPNLIEKIVESHIRMWKINQGLTDHHNWQSQPSEWPFLTRGINYWVQENRQVYFLGNAVVWWSITSLIVAFGFHTFFSVIRWQRGASIGVDRHVYNFNQQTAHYILGWLLHYAPFFVMGRQLFLHHYIPSLYFGILSLGHLFDLLVSFTFARRKFVAYILIGSFFSVAFLFYVHYSSLIYAAPWTKQECQVSAFVPSWDFSCDSFFESLDKYSQSEDKHILPTSAVDFKQAIPVDNNLNSQEAEQTPESKYVPPPLAEQQELIQEVKDEQSQEEIPGVEANEPVEQIVPPLAAEAGQTEKEDS